MDDLRRLWREHGGAEPATPAIEAIQERSRALARKLGQRKWSETIAGALSMAALAAIAVALVRAPLVRLACAMLVVGQAIVIATLWRRGTPAPAPPLTAPTHEHLAHYRAELVRERDLLRTVWSWYLAPNAPGLLLLPIAVCLEVGWNAVVVGAVSLLLTLLVYAIIVLVNRRMSNKLAREIDALAS